MSTVRSNVFCLVLLLLATPVSMAKTGHSEFGPVVGLSLPFDKIGGKVSNGAGVIAGLSGLYRFDQGDFRTLALEYGMDYSLATALFKEVTLQGRSGRFWETIGILSFGGGLRKFLGEGSFSPFLGLRPGFYFAHGFSTSFRDRFNNPLPNPGSPKHFNFGFRIPLGVSWKPTFRWDIGIGLQLDLIIRSAGVIPGVSFPVSVRMSF